MNVTDAIIHYGEIPILIIVGLLLLPYWLYEDIVKYEVNDD